MLSLSRSVITVTPDLSVHWQAAPWETGKLHRDCKASLCPWVKLSLILVFLLVSRKSVMHALINNSKAGSCLGAALDVGLYQGSFVNTSWSGRVLSFLPSSLFFISWNQCHLSCSAHWCVTISWSIRVQGFGTTQSTDNKRERERELKLKFFILQGLKFRFS